MAISFIQPAAIGNALQLVLDPPKGAVLWRVLRKPSDTFTGVDDPSAAVVYDGNDIGFVDTLNMTNGLQVFYKFYSTTDGVTWTDSTTMSNTPASTYMDAGSDLMLLLQQRLEAGLAEEVKRGNLSHELGYIPVYWEFPAQERDIKFPVVTVHFENYASDVRGIGEYIAEDYFDIEADDWDEAQGWLANCSITLVGWSLNSLERSELRRAIRRVIQGNLNVFNMRGIQRVDISQSESFTDSDNSTIYQVQTDFSCLVPDAIVGKVSKINHVNTKVI